MQAIEYKVGPIREAGIKCKWSRTRRGRPAIFGYRADHGIWYIIDRRTHERAQVVGYKQAFNEATALGQFFSVPA